MKKQQKRKSTKPNINWLEIMITGLVDLLVGVLIAWLTKRIE